jgi:hypothetical protein
MLTITTQYTSNASGRSQIVAKGGGRQRTVSVDLAKSADWNHGTAAGTLALVLVDPLARQAHADRATHTYLSDGKRRFTL